MKKSHHEEKKNFSSKLDKKTIGLFFLGVGVTTFILNIATFLTLFEYIEIIRQYPELSFSAYYVSIVSSLILIFYSLFNIYDDE